MEKVKESKKLRFERIAETNNGSTMKTRVVRSKKEKENSRSVSKKNFKKEIEDFIKD